VPVMLVSTKLRRLCVMTWGLWRVAVCRTASTPAMHCLTTSRSLIEPSLLVKSDGLMSRPMTSWCVCLNVRTNASPKCPLLPVTKTFMPAVSSLWSIRRSCQRCTHYSYCNISRTAPRTSGPALAVRPVRPASPTTVAANSSRKMSSNAGVCRSVTMPAYLIVSTWSAVIRRPCAHAATKALSPRESRTATTAWS
jgi:hypothetical protein